MITSTTHPLVIDAFPLASGQVGMTSCPGRKGVSITGDLWNRDLSMDIAALRSWRADYVISLTEDGEMAALGIPMLGKMLEEAGICWAHLPIRDAGTPDADWHSHWQAIAPELHQSLDAGARIIIHCRAGLERSAIVAALLQCERGATLSDALQIIAQAREGAGPLPHQLRWLKRNAGKAVPK